VVAVPDPTLGQAVGAAVIKVPGADLDAAGIVASLRDRLSTFKVPRVLVVCDDHDEIPLTPTNKVDKRALAALVAERGEWPTR
jgi:acyl-CoA synthetase (AMP-forming)/AMP-acid ligase II